MSIVFEPLPFLPTYRKVAIAIAERIVDRQLLQGVALPPELELATQFSVNRSTVREALRELESRGLVARGKGTKRMIVARPATADLAVHVSNALALHDVTVAEVWETLMILEPSIAEIAAREHSDADLELLRAAGERFRASEGETLNAIAVIITFFNLLGAASGNRALIVSQEPLLQLLKSSLRIMLKRTPRWHARIATAQGNIIEAVAARDTAKARLWMERHIRDFRRGFDVANIELKHRVKLHTS
jgi:GntR family transcriptional regulator, transcriptional repressor for pyruvate dehydrogenase complex